MSFNFGGGPAASAPTPAPDGFAGLVGTALSAQGTYFDVAAEGPGSYTCKIADVLGKNTRANGFAIVIELEVIASNNARVPVGSKRSIVNPTMKDYAKVNLTALAAAAFGFDRNNADDLSVINGNIAPALAAIYKAAAEQKTMNGLLLKVDTNNATTKKGQVITTCRYSPGPGAVRGEGIRG